MTVVTELQHYYKYPTTTTIFEQGHTEMEFPAITVCNLNPLNKNVMKNDPRIDNYFLSLGPLDAYANSTNWSDPFYEQEGFYQNRTIDDILNENKDVLGYFLYLAYFDMNVIDISEHFTATISRHGPCVTSIPGTTLKTKNNGGRFNLVLWFNVDRANDYYGRHFGEGLLVNYRIE
jgi:hypothetical protein